jgi:hypothetical protein
MVDRRNPFNSARDEALVATVVPWIMPDPEVSARTHATRMIGAGQILQKMISGDLSMNVQMGRDAVGELLGRIVANAEQHGIVISTQPPEAPDEYFGDLTPRDQSKLIQIQTPTFAPFEF